MGYGSRRAIEMQKYVVLVTDIPVQATWRQLRAQEETTEEAQKEMQGEPVMESMATFDNSSVRWSQADASLNCFCVRTGFTKAR